MMIDLRQAEAPLKMTEGSMDDRYRWLFRLLKYPSNRQALEKAGVGSVDEAWRLLRDAFRSGAPDETWEAFLATPLAKAMMEEFAGLKEHSSKL
jgi:hypothetical protein